MLSIAGTHLSPREVSSIVKLLRGRFRYFVQTFLPPDWYDDSFHGPLCDFLQYAPSKDRLAVMARTHLKTTVVATLYPIWRTTSKAGIRILIAGNTAPNAQKTLQQIMGYYESNELFRALFPELLPDFRHTRWSSECLEIKRPTKWPEGTFEAVGVGTAVTRRHYNLIIEDDTIAPKKDSLTGEEMMPTREEIEKAVGWHKLTIPLLITFSQDMRVFIGTRWAYFDPINYISEHENASSLYEGHAGRYSLYDVPAEKDGKPSYKRFTEDDLHAIRQGMGSFMYSMLYLNKPLQSAQLKFNPKWTRYYEEKEVPKEGKLLCTVDPADPPTGKSDQCYSAALVALHAANGLYIRGYIRERCTEVELFNKTLSLCDKWGCTRIMLETDRYKHMEENFRMVIAKKNKVLVEKGTPEKVYILEGRKSRNRKKEDRIMKLTPLAESGGIFLKRDMQELESEMYQFPYGRFNDLLDAFAYQVDKDYTAPAFTPSFAKKVTSYGVVSFSRILESIGVSGSKNRLFDVQCKERIAG